ncbi:hypothetical protein [Methylocapsa palsarum]|nr:hypothetical protein [Methylocapsa palsarum]
MASAEPKPTPYLPLRREPHNTGFHSSRSPCAMMIEELMLELVDGRGVAMKLRSYEHSGDKDYSIAAQ